MPENKKNSKLSTSLFLLIECISDPVLAIDNEGTIVGINKAIAKLSDYPMEQQIGKNFTDLEIFSPETKLLLKKNTQERLSGKNIQPYEIKVTTKSEVLCLEVKGNRVVDDGQALDLIILHDVTERSNSQEALKRGLLESEERFRGIIDSIKEAIILVDGEASDSIAIHEIALLTPGLERTARRSSESQDGSSARARTRRR